MQNTGGMRNAAARSVHLGRAPKLLRPENMLEGKSGAFPCTGMCLHEDLLIDRALVNVAAVQGTFWVNAVRV